MNHKPKTYKSQGQAGPLLLVSFLLLALPGCMQKDTTTTKTTKTKKTATTKVAPTTKTNVFEAENDLAYLEQFEKETLEAKAHAAEVEIDRLIALLEEENARINTHRYEPKETFQTMFYDEEATSVDPAQNKAMQDNLDKAVRTTNAGRTLVVRGHADLNENQKNEPRNIALAQKRALAVKNELIKAGVPEDKVEVASLGASDPLMWGNGKDGHEGAKGAYNRRTEILAL